jgi:hypothetical protein
MGSFTFAVSYLQSAEFEYVRTSENGYRSHWEWAQGIMLPSFGLLMLKCSPAVFNQYLFLFTFECGPNLETKGYEIYSKIDQRVYLISCLLFFDVFSSGLISIINKFLLPLILKYRTLKCWLLNFHFSRSGKG